MSFRRSAVEMIRRFVEVDGQQAGMALEGLPLAEAVGVVKTLPSESCSDISCSSISIPIWTATDVWGAS